MILRGVADGLMAQDAAGTVVYANDAAAHILDFPSAEALVSTPAAEIIRRFEVLDEAGNALPPDELALNLALRGIETAERVRRFRSLSTGVERWSRVRSTPAFNEEGRVQLVITFIRDVTASRAAEEALLVSESRLATTLRSIGDAVIATDAAGVVTFMNPVAESLTRWPGDEARGRHLDEVFHIVHEETRQLVESPVTKVLREGTVVGLANHTALIARDGTDVCIADSGAPIRDGNDALVGVVLVFRDVTEERRVRDREHLLAAATARLSASLDYTATLASLAQFLVPGLADWCVVDLLDAQGVLRPLKVAHADPEKLRWAQEVTEKYPPDPTSPYGVHEVIRTGQSKMLAEIPDALLVSIARDEGHLAAMRAIGFTSYMCVPLVARGRALGVISLVAAESRHRYGAADLAFAEELARRAALAIDNARLYREAQDANRLKDDFLATVSHELRTPLTAVLGWTRMLRAGMLSVEKRVQALETVERNAWSQVQLIEDLLDISRIITGKLRLSLHELDPAQVIAAAIEAVRPTAEARGIGFDIALDPEAGPVLGDANRLQQVVWNLLSNAVKFTHRGGKVRVLLERAETDTQITVEDTGQGITPEFLPHVFERFRQADSSITRAHGGLGLGLAISRQFVELHGGTIEVQSEGEGRGATFCIRIPRLPRAPASDPALRRAERPGPQLRPGPVGPPSDAITLTDLHLLVVDDDADARDLLLAVLEGAGARVEAVASVPEAMEALRRRVPDVLVSDIGMPDSCAVLRNVE